MSLLCQAYQRIPPYIPSKYINVIQNDISSRNHLEKLKKVDKRTALIELNNS